MGWEKGGRYYTRSHKIGGRVVREYIGSGIVAELAEQLDRDQRSDREQLAKNLKAEKEKMGAVEAEVAKLCEMAEVLARAILLAAGYRQHKRGEWRRKRGQ